VKVEAARQIPLSRPDVGPLEEEYVLAALRSGVLGLGPYARNFEKEFAAFCGCEHAVAVSSGTAGLHLLVRAAGIGEGDEVVTAPISFVASANVMLYERATPVFADVDPDTFVLDPAAVEAAITPRTRGILPVHVFGYPCDMEALGAIADRHGLAIIEDACEAVGSVRSGKRIGGSGTPAVFAFYPNKQMTTGEGGMVTTDDPALAAQVRSLSNQGRSDTGDWLEHDRLGFNYRMDELSAAVGLAQAERLEEILAARAEVAARYDVLLGTTDGVSIPAPTAPGDVRSWFVYVVRLDAAIDRDAVMAAMQARGVACKPYLPAVHLQPFYRSLGHRPGEFPVAEAIARSTLALPFHTRLAPEDQAYVAACLADVLG
jgi:dTDP-4-amino-4,6-dideoxygalactose transaminase